MAIKVVPVADLVPGDVLNQDIMLGTQVLLRRGSQLNEAQIERIKRLSLQTVAVQAADTPPRPAASPAAEVAPPKLKRLMGQEVEAWMSNPEFNQPVPVPVELSPAEQLLAEAKDELRAAAGLKPLIDPVQDEQIRTNFHSALVNSAVLGKVELERVAAVASELTACLKENPEGYLSFVDVPKYGYNLATRGLMSTKTFGRVWGRDPSLQLDEAVRAQLALTSMYSLLPTQLACRIGELTPDEKETARNLFFEVYGWLRAQRFVPEALLEEVMLQCEMCSGEGLPYGLSGDEIPAKSQSWSLSWFYSCKLYSTPEHPRLKGHQAADELVRASGRIFSSPEVNRFLKVMGYYPDGSLVELSDGRLAIVVSQNVTALLLPRVRVVTPDGEVTDELDLRSATGVYIRQQVVEY